MRRRVVLISFGLFCLSSPDLLKQCFGQEVGRIEQARESVFKLLDADRFIEAEAATNKLVNDFACDTRLPWARYWIAERYERRSRFDDAKRIYEEVIKNHPDSTEAVKVEMSFRRAGVKALITSGKFDQAGDALNKLADDFAGNPDLPETLYWITERYERAGRFEDAKRNYQRIMQDFPGISWADKAKLGVSRADVMSLVLSRDFEGAGAALDKLTSEFAGNPDLPETLYWITERYVWVNRFDEAKHICRQIVENYPASSYADRAKLRISIAEVVLLISSQDYDGAKTALDKAIIDYKDHPDLPLALIIIGEKYYRERKADDSVERAKEVFRIVADELNVTARTPEACCWAGDACMELGRYEEAIAYYNRSCDGFAQYGCSPGSRFDNGFRTRSLYMLGQSYQKLTDANGISSEQAEPLIIDSYERLVREFENCAVTKDAWRELGRVYSKSNRPQDTVRCYEAYLKLISDERCPADVFHRLASAYDETGDADSAKKNYTKFLMSVTPTDPRREEVKLRLAAMGTED